MSELVIKPGPDLSDQELAQLNVSIAKEFPPVPLLTRDDLVDRLFFLLMDDHVVLAFGALWEVTPVILQGKTYSIHAFLNVIANIKRVGYGRRVVVAMKDHLAARDLTAFGCTMLKDTGFYEKCGFAIERRSTHRFVYTRGDERITNRDGQVFFYQDSSDRFMQHVLATPDEEVSIPTDQIW
jgi:hypothetical protein